MVYFTYLFTSDFKKENKYPFFVYIPLRRTLCSVRGVTGVE